MIGFGNYTKKEATTITTLTDYRLIKINPQEDGFFDAVLNFKSTDDDINAFIEAMAEVKDAKLKSFYRPIYDPSEYDNKIVYQKGKKPAVGHSYNWWVEKASKMPAVEGRQWRLINEYEQYATFMWLVNQLKKAGKSDDEILNQIVKDSKELGHYYDSKNSTEGDGFELTGSRGVCGLYDLANTYKILACSNEEAGGFWFAGGDYGNYGNGFPLADLYHYANVDGGNYDSVGLLVL